MKAPPSEETPPPVGTGETSGNKGLDDLSCTGGLIGDRSKFIHEPRAKAQSPKSILKGPSVQSGGKDKGVLKGLGSKHSTVPVEREKFIHEPRHDHHETKSILKNKKYERHDVPEEEVEKGQHFSARRLMCVDEQDHNVLLSGHEKAEAMRPSLSLRRLKKERAEEGAEDVALEKKPLSHSKIKSVDEEDKIGQDNKEDSSTVAETLRKMLRIDDFKLHSARHMVKAKSDSHVKAECMPSPDNASSIRKE